MGLLQQDPDNRSPSTGRYKVLSKFKTRQVSSSKTKNSHIISEDGQRHTVFILLGCSVRMSEVSINRFF